MAIEIGGALAGILAQNEARLLVLRDRGKGRRALTVELPPERSREGVRGIRVVEPARSSSTTPTLLEAGGYDSCRRSPQRCRR